MTTPLLLFAASLALLLVAAHFFTGAAERIGLALGLSPFVVGVMIVAVGTSLPELVASVLSVRAGTSEIVAGNVLGANATNLLLVLGAVSAASRTPRISLGEQYIFIDLHFLLGGMVLLGAMMMDGLVSRLDGGLLVAAYLAFVIYLVREGRTPTADADADAMLGEQSRSIARDGVILLAAGAAIYLGGDFTVQSLEQLATMLAISPAIASITILSLGTTLPELVISLTATRRGQAELAVGNILGSCVFNTLAVSGVAALVGGVTVPAELLAFALPFVAASTLFFYLLTQDKRISRWEGMLLLVMFAYFMLTLVQRA
jgi:cation:H+ antiporter